MFLLSLASITVDVMLPIALVAGAGFVLARLLRMDARPLSQSTLYFFSPVLVFVSAYQAKFNAEYASIALFGLIITALTGAITWVTVRTARFDRITGAGFSLGTMLVNSGNYGLPLILFAYGQTGLTYATFYFSVTMLLLQAIAVFIAARGRAHTNEAIRSVLKMPILCRRCGCRVQSDGRGHTWPAVEGSGRRERSRDPGDACCPWHPAFSREDRRESSNHRHGDVHSIDPHTGDCFSSRGTTRFERDSAGGLHCGGFYAHRGVCLHRCSRV